MRNKNYFKELTLIRTCKFCEIYFIMNLPPPPPVMPFLKKARSPNNPRFLDYLVTWQSKLARVPRRAPEPWVRGCLLDTKTTN